MTQKRLKMTTETKDVDKDLQSNHKESLNVKRYKMTQKHFKMSTKTKSERDVQLLKRLKKKKKRNLEQLKNRRQMQLHPSFCVSCYIVKQLWP